MGEREWWTVSSAVPSRFPATWDRPGTPGINRSESAVLLVCRLVHLLLRRLGGGRRLELARENNTDVPPLIPLVACIDHGFLRSAAPTKVRVHWCYTPRLSHYSLTSPFGAAAIRHYLWCPPPPAPQDSAPAMSSSGCCCRYRSGSIAVSILPSFWLCLIVLSCLYRFMSSP